MSETKTRSVLAGALLTSLQILAGALLTIGSLIAAALAFGGSYILHREGLLDAASKTPQWGVTAIFGLTMLVVIGVPCLLAVIDFILLCQEIKRGDIFTADNCCSLARIACCCLISGLGMIPVIASMPWILPLFRVIVQPGIYAPPYPHLALFMLLLLGVAAIARVLLLMCRRAMALQNENDLTI